MMLIQEGVPEPVGGSSFIPLPPDWIRLLRYYEAHAPERLPDPESWPPVGPAVAAGDTAGLSFTRHALPAPAASASIAAAIANVRFLDLDNDGKLDVIGSDMRTGNVYAGLAKDNFALKTLAHL